MAADSLPAGNPFPGLRPFREDEETLFFGRESQVDAMVDRLAATHFLAVVGTSGSGKSSLVNCGLVPALHRGLMAGAGSAWRVASLRPGNRPVAALAEALAQPGVLGDTLPPGAAGFAPAELLQATLRMGRRGLVEAFVQARLPQRQRLLVVVDQFEELFRYRALAGAGAAEDATALVDLLLEAAADPALAVHVVLTMRSDFLGDCAQFYGLPEAINRGQYLVPRMTRDERRRAIAGPLGVAGTAIDPVLLTRLVNDVGDNPDQLSVLQHALNRTWAQWAHEGARGPMTARHYDTIGTMEQALDRHADEAWRALDTDALRDACGRLFRAITDATTDARGTRRPTRFDALLAITGAPESALRAVIEAFRDPQRAFLLPPAGVAIGPETPVDIAHESLMRVWQRLRRWSEDEARSAQTYRRLAETAELERAPEQAAGLLRPPDLPFALEWQRRERPTAAWAARYRAGYEAMLDFLARSERRYADEQRSEAAQAAEQAQLLEDRRRARARLRIALAFGIVTGVASVLTVWSWLQMREERAAALHQADIARAAQAEADRQAQVARRATTSQETQAKVYAQLTQNAPALRAQIDQALEQEKLVYLQYPQPELKDLALRLKVQLARRGYSSPGAEAVSIAPARSDVRYFRKADADSAAALADLLRRWNFGSFAVRYVKGYEGQELRQMEIWFARQDAGEIEALVQRLNGSDAADRKAAGQVLQDCCTASPTAIGAALSLLESGAGGSLSVEGRINALYFLTRSAPLAWDQALVARGRAVAATVRGGGADTQAELRRLQALLDAAAAGQPAVGP